jgi:hypothetical protein
MTKAWRSTAIAWLGLWAAGCTNAWSQEATGSFERALDVDGPVRLEVLAGSGRVAVRQGPDGRVEIAGRVRIRSTLGRSVEEAESMVARLEANPPISMNGTNIRVGPITDRDYRHDVSISYAIVVPQSTSVRSRTGSGSQALSGVAGGVDAGAGSGSISLQDIGGAVRATAGSGSIRAEGVAGAFEAHTGSGSIGLVQTEAGDVEVSAGSGNIDLRGVTGAVRSRSGSGSVRVQGRPGDEWDLQTGSGSIRLQLPADAAFDIDAHAGSGGIRTDHPVTQQGDVSRHSLSGTVRGGGPLVRARTGSGSIRIE